MTSADFEYGDGDSPSSFSRWLIPALVLSILLHVGFWYWARGVNFASGKEAYDKMVPRVFHLERATIDPKLLEPDPAEVKKAALTPEVVKLPDEKPAFQSLMAETKGPATAPKIEQNALSEKPTVASTTFKETARLAEKSGAQSVLQDSQSLQNAILNEKPDAGAPSMNKLVDPEAMTGKAIAEAGPLRGSGKTPGFSNLDDLLAQTGPLGSETAPIMMPGDLLFAFDSANLSEGALVNIQKLGTLIKRNPQATFIIEGHTDSIGSDEYNLALSQQRAESVKAWLVTNMQIPAGKIEAKGYGKTRLIAPASGDADQQQINRRVEIVIRAPKTN